MCAREPDEEGIRKKLAYYSAAATAWFNTRLEHDKSLLTLSPAGIGVDSILPQLFEQVIIPPTVFAELQHPNTPAPV